MEYKFRNLPDPDRIWIAGSRGLVGSALSRKIPGTIPDPSREKLDLTRQKDVEKWLYKTRPELIFLAAARVGGIADNAANPADFITANLQIATNVIMAAAEIKVTKLVYLSSSCVYPRDAAQPMREEDLLSGTLEETNRAYALAKLAGMELVRAFRAQYGCDFISVLPCNLYGPGDTYHMQHSHVIPALMLKIRVAMERGDPQMVVWGSGKPLREFMHVDDLAEALVHVASHYDGVLPMNIGTGEEVSIADLAKMLCEIAGYKGKIVYDASKPDGVPRKILDVSRLSASSWKPTIPLRQGLETVWRHFLLHPLPHQSSKPTLLSDRLSSQRQAS